MRRFIAPLIVTALVATSALAHPRVVSSSPAADASVAPTNRIKIKFSEKLVAQLAGASLEMTEMPGMRMKGATRINIATSVSPDGTTLIGQASKLLPAGTYKLSYHVVSSDTHRVQGAYSFKVQ